MQKFRKICFVCNDNTCLSIMAEAIMNSILGSIPELEGTICASKGLVVLFPEPLNATAVDVLTDNGLKISKTKTEALSLEDIGGDTLILTMTETEKKKVREGFPSVVNMYSLCEFAGQDGEVRRLHGGSRTDYEHLYEQMDLLVKFVVRRLRNDLKRENDE